MNARKNNDGYSLIEVLIAMAIFSIGFLAVASLQTDAVMKTTSARNITEALELAGGHVEFLQGLPLYDDTLDLNGNGFVEQFDIHPDLADGDHEGQDLSGRYTIRWAVTPDKPLPALSPNPFSTVGPDPLTISKAIMVTVFDSRNLNQPLAELEMVKIWDKDG